MDNLIRSLVDVVREDAGLPVGDVSLALVESVRSRIVGWLTFSLRLDEVRPEDISDETQSPELRLLQGEQERDIRETERMEQRERCDL